MSQQDSPGNKHHTTSARAPKNTGRWTEEERTKFMLAFEQFGGNWKMIAKRIGTRTNIQCRTHGLKMAAMQKHRSLGSSPRTLPQSASANMAAARVLEAPKLHPDGSNSSNAMFCPLPPPWMIQQQQLQLPPFGIIFSPVTLPTTTTIGPFSLPQHQVLFAMNNAPPQLRGGQQL